MLIIAFPDRNPAAEVVPFSRTVRAHGRVSITRRVGGFEAPRVPDGHGRVDELEARVDTGPVKVITGHVGSDPVFTSTDWP